MADTENFAEGLNAASSGWNAAMGLRFVHANRDEIVAELTIGAQHLQPHGIVHGGVYAGVVEAIASTGAALFAMGQGASVVGLENPSSFLHAVREGVLKHVSKPLTRGRRTQVWEGTLTDAEGRIAATGRVRLLCLEAG